MANDLSSFGWSEEFSQKWQELELPGTQPARVVADFGTSLKVALPDVRAAELSGALAHYGDRQDMPKVGDWVAVRVPDNGQAVIEAVIPRRSEIFRKAAGTKPIKQVIAANVDIAFVLLAMDNDFSTERLKRFLYQLSINNIDAVIVLNKADKAPDPSIYTKQLHSLNIPVIITTATTGAGVEEILTHIRPGRTAILLGSSGVGKSTLTNQLLGRDAQATQDVRASDSTGKHTTVHRELFVLPGGGLLIDTPGVRELQLWGDQEALDENFDDVAALASICKYTTCQHGGEAGCAIRHALQNGTLDKTHYSNYLKMKTELAGLDKQRTVSQRRSNKKSQKSQNRQAQDTLRESREEI